MLEKLHFTVDPSILNLPRQMYWYENKEKEALRFLHVLCSGGLNTQQCYDLFNGDAYFITKDGGVSLTLVEKKDLDWIKEVEERKRYLEKKAKEEEYNKSHPFCKYDSEPECKYCAEDNRCLYSRYRGYKTTLTECEGGECYFDNYGEKEQALSELNIDSDIFMESMQRQANIRIGCMLAEGKDKVSKDLAKKFLNKQYDFLYKGHQYTINDSARNQSECPHCSERSPDRYAWKLTDKGFIGKHNLNDIEYALCFECPKCFKKFYYHNEIESVDNMVKRKRGKTN